MSLSRGDRPQDSSCGCGMVLFPQPKRPPRGGSGRAGAVGGLAGPAAHQDWGLLTRKGQGKCWKTPLKGQTVGAARLPGLPPGGTGAGAARGRRQVWLQLPRCRRDAGRAKRGERRGTGKARPGSPAAPSPSLARSSPPSHPPPGLVDVAGEPVALPVPGPAVSRRPVPGRAGKGMPSPAWQEEPRGRSPAAAGCPGPSPRFGAFPAGDGPTFSPRQGSGTLGSTGVPAPI